MSVVHSIDDEGCDIHETIKMIREVSRTRNNVTKIFEVIGNHKGFDYAVTLNDSGLRVGYLKIPENISDDKIRDIEFYGNFMYLGLSGKDIPDMYTNYPLCKSDHRWIGFGNDSVRDYHSTACSFGRVNGGNIFCSIEDIKYEQFFVDECKRVIDGLCHQNLDTEYINKFNATVEAIESSEINEEGFKKSHRIDSNVLNKK